MQGFTARLEKRPGIFIQQLGQLPPSIKLFPRKWSAADIGGSKQATIEATGTAEDLGLLLTWLGDRAVIDNEFSTPVWWGVIYEVEANFGHMTVTLSLETIYNRIAVIYPARQADGSTKSEKTAWAEDSNSINRYGRRDWLYSLAEGTGEIANGVRDRLLKQYADPSPVIMTSGSQRVGATLHCRGLWHLTDAIYWTNPNGLVEHNGSGGGVQSLGASYTANTISFGPAAAPAEDDGLDDIKDTANGLGPLVDGTVFTVRGAAVAANNGTFAVQLQHNAGYLETIENAQVDEDAGANVTISLGEGGMVGWIAQSFTAPSGWTATRAALRVQRVGDPADNLDYRIHANGAGIPGTTLAHGAIPGSGVPTTMNWVEIELDAPLLLVGGTTYWIEVGRSGATSLTDYYIVGLDEALGHSGTMKVYTGSNSVSGSWQTREVLDPVSGLPIIPDADLPFRIVGEVDSITQMAAALDTSPDLVHVLPKLTSNVLTPMYRETERSIQEEVMDMLELSTDQGDKLLVRVTYGRDVIIEVAPESTEANPMLGRDGHLHHASGAQWQPGAIPVGQYIDIEALPVLDGLTQTKGQRAVYLKEAEYDAQQGRLLIQAGGATDPWRAVNVRKG